MNYLSIKPHLHLNKKNRMMNKVKSPLFDQINKIDKLFSKVMRKKMKSNILQNENGPLIYNRNIKKIIKTLPSHLIIA